MNEDGEEAALAELATSAGDAEREYQRRKARSEAERDAAVAAQPAVAAATCLLRLALGTGFQRRARRPQALMLVLPDAAWAEAVREAWRLHFKGGRSPEQVGRTLPGAAGPHDWVCIVQSNPGKPFSRSVGIDTNDVERALAAGGELLVLAHAEEAVPGPVREAMDQVAAVPPMDWAVLRHVAEALHGPWAGRGPVSDDVAARATLTALALAARRAGTAADYVERVARIAAAESAPQGGGRPPGPRGLARVPGLGQTLDWGRALAADLAAYRSGRLPWSDVDRGAILVAPPGTGKTPFARALAEEADVPLIATSYAAWQARGHQGDMLRAMRKSFDEARAAAPSILFIDEVDSFPHRDRVRSDHADYVRGVVNGLLAELDGATSRDGVVVIGACNTADNLDPALTRPGRLDRIVPVGLPDFEGRAAILRVHLGPDLPGADLWQVARIAEGMSGAELEKAVREARRAG